MFGPLGPTKDTQRAGVGLQSLGSSSSGLSAPPAPTLLVTGPQPW